MRVCLTGRNSHFPWNKWFFKAKWLWYTFIQHTFGQENSAPWPWSSFTSPGVRFSKDPKTSRARKPPRKAPETTFGCFSKHPKTFDPEKYVIFPRKLHGYSLPPEKRFRVCFSCTCLIKWRPPTYFLGQNKRQWSCIKRERVEEGTENNVVRKYGFYQNEFQWLIAVDRQISKH